MSNSKIASDVATRRAVRKIFEQSRSDQTDQLIIEQNTKVHQDKFLVITDTGSVLHIAKNLLDEGASVIACILDPAYKDVYEDIVPKIQNYNIALADGDRIIIFDSKNIELAERLRREDYAVIGGGSFSTMDTVNLYSILESEGLSHPEISRYSGSDLLKLENASFPYSFRSTVDGQSYFLKDRGDILENVARFGEETILNLRKHVDGPELKIEAWYDGEKFCSDSVSIFEGHNFLPGDLGVNVDCAYSLTVPGICDSLFESTLKKLEKHLGYGYAGPVQLTLAISRENKTPYVIEASTDWLTSGMLSLVNTSLIKFFKSLCEGTLDVQLGHASRAGVRVSIPPYPILTEGIENIPVRVPEESFINLSLKLQNDVLCTTGSTGLLGEVFAVDKQPYTAVKKMHEIAKNIKLSQKQYRSDACESALRRLTEIKNMKVL